MNMPRDFFENNVKPSYQNWRNEPLEEYRVRALFGFANDMAEWMFHHLALEKVYQDRGPAQYRDALAEECPDFGLLRDIADGTWTAMRCSSGYCGPSRRYRGRRLSRVRWFIDRRLPTRHLMAPSLWRGFLLDLEPVFA